ncbi:hypothetical protein ACKWTF_006551 [Chironomus riparius]
MIFVAIFSALLGILSTVPVPQKVFDFNLHNGFPGQGYGFPAGKFGFSAPGFQFNANGFNSYPFNSFSVLANGSIYNSATGNMINGLLISSTSNGNNINFAANPGIDVRVG